MNMTDEQMRIAIAEARGIQTINSKCWRGHLEGVEVRVPDYLNDLNAMHEAEKLLNSLQLQDYTINLLRVINAQAQDRVIAQLGCFIHIHATASQRAIAFIKTLNLEPK